VLFVPLSNAFSICILGKQLPDGSEMARDFSPNKHFLASSKQVQTLKSEIKQYQNTLQFWFWL